MSRANICGALQSVETALRSLSMSRRGRERPVFHLQLGQYIAGFRANRKWSIHRAVLAARHKGHAALTDNKLRWMEEGKTKAPDQDVLRAIADIYEVDYIGLARAFVEANYGSDLLRHPADQRSASAGGADVPASDERRRIRDLEQRIADLEPLETRWSEVQDVARALFRLTANEQDLAVAPAAATRRKPGRKTG